MNDEISLNRIDRDTELRGKVFANLLNVERSEVTEWMLAAIRLFAKASTAERSYDAVLMGEEDVAALEKLYSPIHFHIYPRGALRNGEWMGTMLPVDRSRLGNLALDLWKLAEAGAIPRLRQCKFTLCGKWFFALRDKQKYCPGKKCVEAERKSSEHYKLEQTRRVTMHYYVHGDGKKSQTKVAKKWRREWEKKNARKTR